MQRARDDEAAATDRVLGAERDLTRIRADGAATADVSTAAEKRLDFALRDLATSQARTTAATEAHTTATRRLGEETDRNSTALGRLRTAVNGTGTDTDRSTTVLGRLRSALRGVGDDSGSGSRLLSLFGRSAKDTDGATSGLLTKLSLLGNAAHGLSLFLTPTLFAEAIGPALGLAGAAAQASGALAIIPGVLATLGVAFGALKIATSGFGSALKDAFKNIDDPAKVTEALKNLTPAAQDAARAVIGLKKPFDDLKNSLQESFFRGLGTEITATGNALINTFRPAFQTIAVTANTTLKGILTDLRGVREQADLRSIGASGSTVFKNLAAAARPLLQAFLDIAQVGAKVFADITGGVGAVTQKFADWVAELKQSGRLEEFIRGGLTALKELGQVAGNVGSILVSVFKASSVNGQSFLDTLRDGTRAMADFAKSAQGQELFQALFAVLHDLTAVVTEVIHVLPSLTPVLHAAHEGFQALFAPLGSVVDGIGALLVALAPLLPLAGQIGGAIGSGLATVFRDLAPIITNIVTGIRGLVTNAMPGLISGFTTGWEATKPLLEALGNLAVVVLPPLGTALGVIARIIGPFTPVILSLVAAFKAYSIVMGVVTTVTELFAVAESAAILPMLAAAAPVVALVAALALLAVGIYEVVKNWDAVTAATGSFLSYVSSTFLDGLRQIGDGIASFVGGATSMFVDGLNQIGGYVAAGISYTGSTFTDGLNQMGSAVSSFFSATSSTFLDGLNQIGSYVASGASYVGSTFVDGLNQMGTAAVNGINYVVSIIGGLGSRALSALGNVGTLLWDAGASLVTGFLNGIKANWDQIVSWVESGMTELRSLWPFSPAKTGPFSGTGYVTYSGAALTRDFGNSILKGIPGVVAAARQLAQATVDAGTVDLTAAITTGAFGSPVGVKPLLAAARTAATPDLAAHRSGSVSVVQNIYNPSVTDATDSSNRELRRFAAMGGFSR